MNIKRGYRGYISSRAFGGERAPQHIQNLVIRSYCNDNDLPFLLSATEVAMPDSFIVLSRLMTEINGLSGIVFYSLQQLPKESSHRAEIFDTALRAKRELHFAVERFSFETASDGTRIEDILSVAALLPRVFDLREWYEASGNV